MSKVKGIILAGGKATRLYPITRSISKQLLPVYDKPMIYYPLSVLMLGDIRDILIISTREAIPRFQELLGDGSSLGINLSYAEQEEPRGLADAFIVGEKFIGNDRVALILGDNIFFGNGLPKLLSDAARQEHATIFAYYMAKELQRYGVVELDGKENIVSVEEKPKNPKSNWVSTGLYFFDSHVVDVAKSLKPSPRGELEITDVMKAYLKDKKLKAVLLGRGYAWLDTGDYDSLLDASSFIRTIEERQGMKICCVEEIAYKKKFISEKQLLSLADEIKTTYGDYLKTLVQDNGR